MWPSCIDALIPGSDLKNERGALTDPIKHPDADGMLKPGVNCVEAQLRT